MNQAFYQTIVQESPSAYAYHKIILSPEGSPCDYEFLEVNPAFERYTGLKADDVLGKRIREIIPGIGTAEFDWIKTYGRVALTGIPIAFEQYSEKLGCWYRIKAISPEKNYFVTFFSDISYETEQQFALKNFFAISPDLLSIADSHGRLLSVNAAWKKVLGYSDQALKRKKFVSYVHPEDREDTISAMRQLKNQQEIVQVVNRFKNSSGEYRYIEWCARLEGEISYVAGRDITEKIEKDRNTKKLLAESETIFNATQDGLFMLGVLDKGYSYIKNNTAYERLTGIQSIQGKTPQDLWGNEPAKKITANYDRCTVQKDVITYEETLPLPKGDRIFSTTLTPILESDSTAFIVGSRRDITEEKKAQAMLLEEKERLRITLLSVGDGVIATDASGKITIMNAVAEKLTGWTLEEAHNVPFNKVFHIINEYTRDVSPNPVQIVLETGKIIGLANHTILVAKDRMERPIADSAAPIIEDGAIKGVILVFRDVTAQRQKQAMIEHLSFHDQLTDLFNRRFFEEEIRRLDVQRNLPFAIVITDVNGLKLTNDAFGHQVGDRLLVKAADTMQACCRKDDILARLGGDEFVILMPRTGKEEAEQIVQRIIEQCACVKVDVVTLSVSCGFAVKTGEEKVFEVLKKAEDMMYRRKLFEGPSIRGQIIDAVVKALYEANRREQEHSERVSMICEKMGQALGCSEREVQELRTAGLLHDIGKVGIDVSIIDKPGTLTESEWTEIKRHPEIGYRILSAVHDMSDIAQSVLAHHERWDGKGYPQGIGGEMIPLHARILAIADAYDAMTCERPYRKPLPMDDVEKEMRVNAGAQFDASLVRVFLQEIAPTLR